MPSFKNPAAVVDRINDFPQAAAKLLESVLTQEQIETVERDLFPQPEPEEREQALRQAERLLKRAGLPDTDPVLIAIASNKLEAPAPEILPEVG